MLFNTIITVHIFLHFLFLFVSTISINFFLLSSIVLISIGIHLICLNMSLMHSWSMLVINLAIYFHIQDDTVLVTVRMWALSTMWRGTPTLQCLWWLISKVYHSGVVTLVDDSYCCFRQSWTYINYDTFSGFNQFKLWISPSCDICPFIMGCSMSMLFLLVICQRVCS